MSEMHGVPFRLSLPSHAAICASATEQPGPVGALDYFDLQHPALHDDILQTFLRAFIWVEVARAKSGSGEPQKLYPSAKGSWLLSFKGGPVIMKNLFDATVANQVKARLGKLELQNERRWGKMTAAQMLAHCSVSMQWAVGELVPEKGALPTRLMGRLVKPMVFRNEDPLRKNSPTARSLIVADERDLGKERDRLSG